MRAHAYTHAHSDRDAVMQTLACRHIHVIHTDTCMRKKMDRPGAGSTPKNSHNEDEPDTNVL